MLSQLCPSRMLLEDAHCVGSQCAAFRCQVYRWAGMPVHQAPWCGLYGKEPADIGPVITHMASRLAKAGIEDNDQIAELLHEQLT